MEAILQALAFSIPLLLAFLLPGRLRAIVLGTIWVWIVLVTACEYLLATDPEYDSIAPGIAIVAGWVPGLVYSSLCVLVSMVVKSIRGMIGSSRGTTGNRE